MKTCLLNHHFTARHLINKTVAISIILTALGLQIAPTAKANNNEINGRIPKAPTECLAESDIEIMKFNNFNGEFVRIETGVRLPGTRSPVHTHPYGGSTCVIQGEMTLTLEGHSDQTFRGNLQTGSVQCYPMPPPQPGHENKMAATNTGKTPALIIDIFTVPNGANPKMFHPMCVLQTGNPSCYITGAGCDQ